MIGDVAQHRHSLQRDVKLQLSILHLQLLRVEESRVKTASAVAAEQGLQMMAQYLHGGELGLL